jgi:hypothetical protein
MNDFTELNIYFRMLFQALKPTANEAVNRSRRSRGL